MHERERQGGFILFVALILSAFVSAIFISLFLTSEKRMNDFAESQQINDLSALIPSIYESLLRNPALWQHDNAAAFIPAIQAIGFDWPDDLNVHISAVQSDNNISFRHYVVCRRCPNIVPFNASGTFNLAAVDPDEVVYHLINGYHLQLEGISRAQKDLSRIADRFVDAYQHFRLLQEDGAVTCVSAKANGECNYFRGCDFGRDGLLPCTEGAADRRLAASAFGILGGDSFSVWGGIFVYNGGAVGSSIDPQVREHPMALVTTGPRDVQVQLIVPEPI